jgi:hypothetical protein
MLGYGLWWNEHGNLNAEEDTHEIGITLALSRRLAHCPRRCSLYVRLQAAETNAATAPTRTSAGTRSSDRDAAGQPKFYQ